MNAFPTPAAFRQLPPDPAAAPAPCGVATCCESILDALPALVALLDARGVIVGVNRAWHAFMTDNGLQLPDAGLGQAFPELCERLCELAGQDPSAGRAVRDVLEGRVAQSTVEYRCPLTLEERWFRVSVNAAEVRGGRGAAMMYVDITEHRLAERALRTSEAVHREIAEQLGQILDFSVDVICALDAEGRFLRVSESCRKVWGYEPAEMVGRSYREFVFAGDLEATREVAARVASGEPVRDFENRWRRKDGSCGHMSWSSQWSPEAQAFFSIARDRSDAHLMRQAHQMLNERLRTTVENMSDGFATLDRHWRITYMNKACERQLARRFDSVAGRNVWDEFPEAAGTRFQAEYERAMATGEPRIFEEYYAPLDLWLEVRALPTADGLALYFRDDNERRRARQALVESEERFKLVASMTTDAIWDWNVQRGTIWWSQGVEVLFGSPCARAIAQPDWWSGRIHPDDHDEAVASLQLALLADDSQWSAEYRFRRADGTYALVLDRALVIRDETRRAVRMVGAMADLTTQREFEERMRERSALLDNARDAIHVRSLEHRIEYWNRSAEALYGWSAEEAIGRSAPELFQGDPERHREACERLLRDGEFVGELEKARRDGRRLVVEARWTLLRDAHSRPTRVLVMEADVTERRLFERELMRSQRLDSLGTLAGGIAHDLNNVFTPILMSASLLEHPAARAEDGELVAAIRKSAQRGADMVRQLVSFARGADGHRSVFAPARTLGEVARIVRDTFPKDIAVRLAVVPELHAVEGDPTQLHQVLLNLCVNARDAMPAGGRLEIRARNETVRAPIPAAGGEVAPGEQVVIEVEDTGCGMGPGLLDRIFDPFFTTKEPGRGSGLGLSTSLAILRSHGGAIEVRSEPGAGSVFRVRLPAAVGAACEDAAESEGAPRGSGQAILVVDDEPDILDAARRALEAHGYRVLCAHDGAEAVAEYARRVDGIDLALVDMVMPVMDGPATVQVLKKMNPALRVLATSGFATRARVAKASEAGLEAMLPKPYTVDELLRAVARALA